MALQNRTSPSSVENRSEGRSQQASGAPGGPALPGPGGRGSGVRIERARDVQGTTRRLLAYLQPYRWSLIAVLILVVLSTLLSLAVPFLMGKSIDTLLQPGAVQNLLRLVVFMSVINVTLWAISVGQNVIVARFSQRAMRQLRRNLFEHIQKLSLSFFDKHTHGELMSRLTNDMQAINNVLSQNVTEMISGLLTLVGIVIMMFLLNFWLALASMVVLPAMLWLVGFVGKRTRSGFRQYQMLLGSLNGQLEEMYSGQRVIIAFGREGSVLETFDSVNQSLKKVGIRAQIYAMLVPPLMGIMSNANIAIIAGLGGWMAINGLATLGTIATFYNYSRRFAAPLRQLGNLYNQIQSAIAGAERIFEILDQQPELVDVEGAIDLKSAEGSVVFADVKFSYVADVPVIKHMSFSAKPGEIIALVGPTGAGKTTMVNLLSRFYDIQQGHILVDDYNITQVKKDSLRRLLGVVLQDTFLFAETVMENIRYGRLDATDEEVVEAAIIANANQFIMRLPQGYETPLSERANNISQGQRQLLAIARAVLAEPGILILDEATSSVDTRTEIIIQEGLLKLMEGRTSFVIAHRLSTIRGADQVLVINKGEIIERGTHTELLAQGGFYHNLYMSQFKGRTA